MVDLRVRIEVSSVGSSLELRSRPMARILGNPA